MKLLHRLLGTDKALTNIISKDGLIAKAVDSGIFTTQEQSEWKLKFLAAIAPFKVVQRILVGVIMSIWAFICINIVVAIWLEILTDIEAVAPFMAFIATQFIWIPVASAVGLYLGGGFLESRSRKG